MRESPKTEKMRLGDAYEEWLKRQTSQQKGTRHQKPQAYFFETWIEKRVKKKLKVAAS
jgi:hypothetical protein